MKPMQSVMQHDFGRNPKVNMPRSTFNRSHGHKTTLDADFLYPMFVDELIPGDTIHLKTSCFARLNTPIFPLMDNMEMSWQFFAIPERLVWENSAKFFGEQEDPGDSVDFTQPVITTPTTPFFDEGTIFDYMGIPTQTALLNSVNAKYNRAMNLTWNEWYRSQDLQDSLTVPKGDGPDLASLYTLQKRNKRFDYFTQALPNPQKGDAVSLPLGDYAPITGLGKKNTIYGITNASGRETDQSSNSIFAKAAQISTASDNEILYVEENPDLAGSPNIKADLSNATSATINELREAFAIQALYERDQRGGTRYTELIRSHFSVTSPDSRLQRPEYLGGGSSSLKLQEIAQTSSTDGTSPQANMSAQGKMLYQDKGFSYSATEHCVVIGFCSIRADLTYQQGLNKKYTRQTKLDYYWPDLANLGEQAILNQEIYADGSANDDLVFGYVPRWDEMRHFPSIITGKMRSNATGSLDPWHLSVEFGSLPVLNSAFIEENVPVDRVVAITTEPDFTVDAYFNYTHARPMPTYSVPGLGPRL